MTMRTCCTSNQLPCGNFFPWVSRTSFSRQMALMRYQASPTSLWGGHPTRTNKDHPATRPAFLHLWASNACDKHLWWSCWLQGRQQEPVSAEDCCPRNLHRPKDIPKLSATINLWAAEGLLELLLSCLFTLGSELITVTSLKCGTTEIDPLALDDLDGPPKSSCCGHQALTPSLPIGLPSRLSPVRVLLTRNASAKAWKRWQAERQANDSWQDITQRSPWRHSGNTIRVVNLTKLLTDSANIARKKTLQTPKRDPECAPHLKGHEKKSWRTPKKDFRSHFVFELALTANEGITYIHFIADAL